MSFYTFPIMVGWAITNRCNMGCLYCSQDSGRILDEELTYEEAVKVIDDLARYKISIIGFTGGEPLVRDDLPDLIRYATQKNIRCQITTNGIKIADGYPLEYINRLNKVRISLDSFNEDTHDYLRNKKGSYHKVMSAVQRLKNIGMQIEIVTTMSSQNINEFDELLKFITELKIDQWSISVFCPVGRGKENSNWLISPEQHKYISERLWEEKNKVDYLIKTDIPQLVLLDKERANSTKPIFCSAATELMVIFPDGGIAPCFSMPLTAGNVRTHDLYDVWNHSDLFQSLRDKGKLTGKCGACEHLVTCGGCRAMAYAKYNDYLAADPTCWMGVGTPYEISGV